MSESFNEDPKPLGDILPGVIDALEQGEPIGPDAERSQAALAKDLNAEIRELSEEREALGEAIVAGDRSPETKARFDQITHDLLTAQSEHINLDGTTGGNPTSE